MPSHAAMIRCLDKDKGIILTLWPTQLRHGPPAVQVERNTDVKEAKQQKPLNAEKGAGNSVCFCGLIQKRGNLSEWLT